MEAKHIRVKKNVLPTIEIEKLPTTFGSSWSTSREGLYHDRISDTMVLRIAKMIGNCDMNALSRYLIGKGENKLAYLTIRITHIIQYYFHGTKIL